MHGTTFGGGPLACAVAIAVIDTNRGEKLAAARERSRRVFHDAASIAPASMKASWMFAAKD